MTTQVEKFKLALESHANNVRARTERITSRYGRGNEQIKAGVVGLSGGATNYAMFSHTAGPNNGTAVIPSPAENNTGAVRRRNLEAPSSLSGGPQNYISPYNPHNLSSTTGGGLVQELMQEKGSSRSDYRLQTAKSVEASVAQVGLAVLKLIIYCCYSPFLSWVSCSPK
jgi:hypothetical protein